MEQVFASFCGKEKDMDGKSFAKLCKDCKLLDKKFTATDVDLIFAKVGTKGQRRINLEQFGAALEHIATKKGTSAEDVRSLISQSEGPKLSGTQADAVRFHDDKSTYTGTHVNGGPEPVKVGTGTHGSMFADAPGRTSTGGGSKEATSQGRSSERRPSNASAAAVGGSKGATSQGRSSERRPSNASAAAGGGEQPGTKATELRAKVDDVRRSSGDGAADRVLELETALAKSKAEVEELRKAVAQKDEVIAQLRRDASKSAAAPPAQPSKTSAEPPAQPKESSPPSPNAAKRLSTESKESTAQGPKAAAAAPAGSLQEAFSAFADGKSEMDQKSFVKLCKDVKLVDKTFTANDADLIFTKVVTKGQRKINFDQFGRAVDQVATKKGTTAEAVHDAIMCAGGPKLNGTVADHVKFHDDKSTYTGTHVNGGPEAVKVGGTAQSMFT